MSNKSLLFIMIANINIEQCYGSLKLIKITYFKLAEMLFISHFRTLKKE